MLRLVDWRILFALYARPYRPRTTYPKIYSSSNYGAAIFLPFPKALSPHSQIH